MRNETGQPGQEDLHTLAVDKLTEVREDSGLSLRAFADNIDLTAPYLCRVESGRCPLSDAVIERYVHGAVEDNNRAEFLIDEIRLLSGKAPIGLTSEDVTELAIHAQRLKKSRRSSQKIYQIL